MHLRPQIYIKIMLFIANSARIPSIVHFSVIKNLNHGTFQFIVKSVLKVQFPEFLCDAENTENSRPYIWIFVLVLFYQEVFCDVIMEEVLENVRASPYVSIMIDESTDISNTKKMVVYARILDHRGQYMHCRSYI